MKKIFLIFTISTLLVSLVFAHLCNDVFVQAKDNLAIKVDIRDNQLRITKEAEFRVYLLNTMDRDIDDIQLEVISDDFLSSVEPSSSWRTFPVLETKNRGGKKEYFRVLLIRKEGTKEGKHKIGLRLFNGRDESMIFKTVNLEDAIGCASIHKKTDLLKIDGKISREEWQDSYLATDFYEYVTEKVDGLSWMRKHKVNRVSDIKTRVRFLHGENKLYALIDFMAEDTNDKVKIYIAKDHASKPVVITCDLSKKRAYKKTKLMDTKFKSFTTGTKMELEIPLTSVGIKPQTPFYVNLTRTKNSTTTYWSGNESSVNDPIVYATFKLEK